MPIKVFLGAIKENFILIALTKLTPILSIGVNAFELRAKIFKAEIIKPIYNNY